MLANSALSHLSYAVHPSVRSYCHGLCVRGACWHSEHVGTRTSMWDRVM
jgi:hypothetical protein